MVTSVDWTNQAEHRAVLALGARLAAGFLRSGFAPVILVDTFSGDKLNGFLAAFQEEYPQGRVCVTVLHASESVLRDRVLNREGDGFRDVQVSTRLNNDAIRDLRPFEHVINTSGYSPAEVAMTILATLAKS